MKLGLHRSVTFWFGILVMGFICWAWWDSQRVRSVARTRIGEVQMLEGTAGLLFSPGLGMSGLKMSRRDIYRNNQEFSSFPFPRPLFTRGGDPKLASHPHDGSLDTMHESIVLTMFARPSNWWIIFLPHWLLLLAVALAWVGLLLWRARMRASARAVNAGISR
ncbi:hypothetical protein OJ996_25480 [Luteolibacter sp. GHJ8]|uniref:PepSY-associated transmembrane protein n=1 Tax=Luteolibacter rhizosphaerae TaxID=2989719 RepID=A0ABT3GBU3_9BACT|nr:hypothetical protein [Luteolibacter rhizosphaerae]MCW1916966.1 hypothetical protein [Luteolibacter rhizosphaerae]